MLGCPLRAIRPVYTSLKCNARNCKDNSLIPLFKLYPAKVFCHQDMAGCRVPAWSQMPPVHSRVTLATSWLGQSPELVCHHLVGMEDWPLVKVTAPTGRKVFIS